MTQIIITYEESKHCGPQSTKWLKEHLKKKFEAIMGYCPLYIGDAWKVEVSE